MAAIEINWFIKADRMPKTNSDTANAIVQVGKVVIPTLLTVVVADVAFRTFRAGETFFPLLCTAMATTTGMFAGRAAHTIAIPPQIEHKPAPVSSLAPSPQPQPTAPSGSIWPDGYHLLTDAQQRQIRHERFRQATQVISDPTQFEAAVDRMDERHVTGQSQFKGRTLLHEAAAKAHASSVASLINRSANIYASDREGRPPVYAAAKRCEPEITASLINTDERLLGWATQGWFERPDGLCEDQIIDTAGVILEQIALWQELGPVVDAWANKKGIRLAPSIRRDLMQDASKYPDLDTKLQAAREQVELLLPTTLDDAERRLRPRLERHQIQAEYARLAKQDQMLPGNLPQYQALLTRLPHDFTPSQPAVNLVRQAVRSGDPNFFPALLERGYPADPDIFGSSPLATALYFQQWNAARALLDHGADPKRLCQSSRPERPYFTEARRLANHLCPQDIRERLFPPGERDLLSAARQGDLDAVRAAVEAGGELNPPGFGSSPLIAAYNGHHYDVVDYLHEQGANIIRPNPITGENVPVLDIPSQEDLLMQLEEAEWTSRMIVDIRQLHHQLRFYGPIPPAVTPLHILATEADIRHLPELIDLFGVDHPTSAGGTPLDYALGARNVPASLLLLRHGANRAPLDDAELPPLLAAALTPLPDSDDDGL